MPREFPQTKFVGKQHHHGCTTCRRRYGCSCTTPNQTGRCNSCIAGRVSTHAKPWEPIACCTSDNVRPADRHDRERYLLAGQGPWFLCRTCFRQFPCNPEQVARS